MRCRGCPHGGGGRSTLGDRVTQTVGWPSCVRRTSELTSDSFLRVLEDFHGRRHGRRGSFARFRDAPGGEPARAWCHIEGERCLPG